MIRSESFALTEDEFESIAIRLQNPESENEYKEANSSIQLFKFNPSFVLMVEPIISKCESPCAKYLILSIFKEVISKIWDKMNNMRKESLKKFFFSLVTSTEYYSDNDSISTFAIECLVELLKKEWPQQWPDFTRQIIIQAKMLNGAPINCVKLLKILSQEIKESVRLDTTLSRQQDLEKALNNDLHLVLSFFSDIFTQSNNIHLLVASLEAFEAFLKWIDPSEIMGPVFINAFRTIFMNEELRIPILCCFASIPQSTCASVSLAKSVEQIFFFLCDLLFFWIEEGFDFKAFCETSEHSHALALVLTEYLGFNSFFLLSFIAYENPIISATFDWLLKLLMFSDGPTFELCLGFFESISQKILIDATELQIPEKHVIDLQHISINRMIPPHNFPFMNVATNEGIHISLVSIIHDTTKIYHSETGKFLNEAIHMASTDEKIYSISYAISAISGSLPVSEETTIIEGIVDYLLSKIDESQSFSLALVIICTNHTRFLSKHLDFLDLLLNRMMEWICFNDFCAEFQQFVVDSILSICLHIPTSVLSTTFLSHINTINSNNLRVTTDLLPNLYRAFGNVIHGCNDTNKKKKLISSLIQDPLEKWSVLCDQNDNYDYNSFTLVLKIFASLISIGEKLMTDALGQFFEESLKFFYSVSHQNRFGSSSEQTITQKPIKVEIYELFDSIIKSKTDPELTTSIVSAIIEDFKSSEMEEKFPQALSCFSTFVVNYACDNDIVFSLMSEIIVSTAQNLIETQSEDPEIETALFGLFDTIVRTAGDEFRNFSESVLSLLFQSIQWGLTRNCDSTVSLVLNCIQLILENMNNENGGTLFSVFYLQLIDSILEAMIRPMDQNLFTSFSRVLNQLLLFSEHFTESVDVVVNDLTQRLSKFCEDQDLPQISHEIYSLVIESSNFLKFTLGLSDLIRSLRERAFQNESRREEFGLEGGFSITQPSVLEVPEELEEF